MLSYSIINDLRIYSFEAFKLFVALIAGYLLGYFISKVIERLLKITELQKTLVKYGAVTTHLWESIVSFVSQYIKWLILVFIVNVMFIENLMINSLFNFLFNILGFVIFVVLGLLIGGVLYKIAKDTLVAIGLEAELEKHKVADTLGGLPLSSILAGILKWYVVIIFVKQGVELLQLPTLSDAMNQLYLYIPQAILGVLILLATLIIADLASSNVKKKGYAFSDLIGLGVEVVILFFGVILALPRLLGVQDPEGRVFIQSLSVMTDSFKFLMIGVAAGIAIAVGLGLKDAIMKVTTTKKR